ncbi:MAG: putative DNA binding domain-containing protein [Planctomycetaceae bacterium]|nr:putative DNA binding domain-containing protein [Planctomycetaceae bacterium]
MKTAQELLSELNSLDEHLCIEAKTSADVGTSLLETVCAFANEPQLGGGYILLGVAPATNSFWPVYEAVGIHEPDKLQQEIATQCASVFNVPIRPRIVTERIGERTVITVFVPEAGTHEKPVYFKNQPLPKGARRRIGSTDQKCTDDDLIIFYQDRRGESYDEQLVRDATLADIDDEAIELYRKLRREVHAQAEELTWSREDLLEALGAVKRSDGVLKPTVAGVLLFGSSKALRRLFPMLRIDYIRVPGLQWVKDPDKRFETVEIRAPLLSAFQRIRASILDDLPKAFSLPAGEIQGKEIPLLPDRVIREVVANAVMHRDYRVHGSIQIIRYSNRLEVRNPGFSLKAEERLGQPGSETRNPKIAAVLHEVNFAETKGSGIKVMRELMDEQGLSSPVLHSDRTGNSFMAMLLFHHFLSKDDLTWLRSFDQHSLTEDEMRAMISARELGAIDNSTYRTMNREVDTLSASRHLRKLCDCGLLEKKGNGPSTYYVPTQRALENWPPRPENTSQALGGKSTEQSTKSTELEAKSTELSTELQERILSAGRKSDKSALLQLVVDILTERPLSAAELADILGRTQKHIRTEYLQPLLEQGRIVRSNPEKPTDPNQTYTAAISSNGIS